MSLQLSAVIPASCYYAKNADMRKAVLKRAREVVFLKDFSDNAVHPELTK